MYLTGVRQPGILAAISSARGSGKGAFTLFVPDVSQAAAQWDGALLNNAAAEEVFGAHAAFPMSQVPRRAHVACCLHICLGSLGVCAWTTTATQLSQATSIAIAAAPLAAARLPGGSQGCAV